MTMPRPSEESKAFFQSMLPLDDRVVAKPMFGNMAGFVNGNMFTGLFGDDLFVRLAEADRQELLREEGASKLEPMPGRPMVEYVVLPSAWRQEPDRVRTWVERSLAWAARMPEKKPKAKKK